MTPDEALEQLPLVAGGDVDAHTCAAVRAALAGDSDASAELAAWEELDELLERTLSPAARPLVRCPYCRTGVDSAERVLCAECLTPHHDACFAEHGRCSILGCDSLDVLTPRPQVVKRAPAVAARPFRKWRLREFATAAATLLLLLAGGLAIGFFSERTLERTWWEGRGALRAFEDEAEARGLLRAVVRAQERFRAHRLRGGEYAPDLETLRPLLVEDAAWRAGHPGRFTITTTPSLSRPDERFFVTVTRATGGFFATQNDRIVLLEPGFSVDPIACRLRRGPPPDSAALLEGALADLRQRSADDRDRSAEQTRRLEDERKRLRDRITRLEQAMARKDKP